LSEQLIQRLATDLRPVSRMAVLRRLVVGVGLGGLVSVALVGASLGWRPHFMGALGNSMFWLKLVYTVTVAAVAIWACERLSRPAASGLRRAVWLIAPVLVMAALAVHQQMRAPPPMRMHMMMGDSAKVCSWLILTASVPPLAGLIWAVRGLAPMRMRLTGTVLGLAAGGVGASAYALHCPESTAAFMAIWYTLGMAAAGLLGFLVSPRLLRW
jgi:hypothetical protein